MIALLEFLQIRITVFIVLVSGQINYNFLKHNISTIAMFYGKIRAKIRENNHMIS